MYQHTLTNNVQTNDARPPVFVLLYWWVRCPCSFKMLAVVSSHSFVILTTRYRPDAIQGHVSGILWGYTHGDTPDMAFSCITMLWPCGLWLSTGFFLLIFFPWRMSSFFKQFACRQERQCSAHWRKVRQMYGGALEFKRFAGTCFSLPHVRSTWSPRTKWIHRREMILKRWRNWLLKEYCLVCACWLANRCLSLSSRWHFNLMRLELWTRVTVRNSFHGHAAAACDYFMILQTAYIEAVWCREVFTDSC